MFGYLLIGIGVLFLLQSLGFIDGFWSFSSFWAEV
ncbi:hypothetical protein ACFFIX_03845 [Metabacillus herbersteinensis]|uniref:Uncharacterized protein n=1 Tax=Metabacillus herbersteinensis TaxID=283816 RepID=A0ABV6GA87_9BACI